MKNIYRTPYQIKKSHILFLGAFTILSMIFLEWERNMSNTSGMEKTMALSKTMMNSIKELKDSMGIEMDTLSDPLQTGMVGDWNSSTTTLKGDLRSKQVTVNPNFAALAYRLLEEAGVKEGDDVAIGLTGSYPAFNIHVLAAIETIKAHPIIITSLGSSQYGANYPQLFWLDMEKYLFDKKFISTRSISTSLGGVDDIAAKNSREGRKLMLNCIKRHDIPFIYETDPLLNEQHRAKLYKEHTKKKIVAYINIGGGLISAGNSKFGEFFQPGLNLSIPKETLETYAESMLKHYSLEGLPVFHFRHSIDLSRLYKLPLDPLLATEDHPGLIFKKKSYSRILAGFCLLIIIAVLYFSVQNLRRKTEIDAELAQKNPTIPEIMM